MDTIELQNRELLRQLRSQDADATKHRAIMVMKMEQMQEKINYFKKREENLRKEQRALQKLIDKKDMIITQGAGTFGLRRPKEGLKLGSKDALQEIKKSSSQSWYSLIIRFENEDRMNRKKQKRKTLADLLAQEMYPTAQDNRYQINQSYNTMSNKELTEAALKLWRMIYLFSYGIRTRFSS